MQNVQNEYKFSVYRVIIYHCKRVIGKTKNLYVSQKRTRFHTRNKSEFSVLHLSPSVCFCVFNACFISFFSQFAFYTLPFYCNCNLKSVAIRESVSSVSGSNDEKEEDESERGGSLMEAPSWRLLHGGSLMKAPSWRLHPSSTLFLGVN